MAKPPPTMRCYEQMSPIPTTWNLTTFSFRPRTKAAAQLREQPASISAVEGWIRAGVEWLLIGVDTAHRSKQPIDRCQIDAQGQAEPLTRVHATPISLCETSDPIDSTRSSNGQRFETSREDFPRSKVILYRSFRISPVRDRC